MQYIKKEQLIRVIFQKVSKSLNKNKTEKEIMSQKTAEQFSFETKEGEAQIGKYTT